MDQILIDYLRSGKAWLLVGSGPSIAMGYPSWENLAESAMKAATQEMGSKDDSLIRKQMEAADYPAVFDKLKAKLGALRLLQVLRSHLRPNGQGQIYELIARWPVRVYMTTNYDDEISRHLSLLGESYRTYSNSEDHLALMNPEFNGAVVKLHGDLTTQSGLILTKRDYKAIQEDDSWKYWRTKMQSVFQMFHVVIIGHSLTDANIKHVLEAARKGAGVERPVCWIAPDVPFEERKHYLDKYRIRVVPYSNVSGDHKNLIRLIEHINDFMPPRLAVHMSQQIGEIYSSIRADSAAAPAFYVYNRLSPQNFDEKRLEILLAIIESSAPALKKLAGFSIHEALGYGGWPGHIKLPADLEEALIENGVAKGLLERVDSSSLRLSPLAEKKAQQERSAYEHIRERFKSSLELRIKNKFNDIEADTAQKISSDIETSLIGYFRDGGLTLTSALFSTQLNTPFKPTLPSSIIRFISEASTKYDDALWRQAFCTISVDIFAQARSPERDYLGRLAQGFFAYHVLGVFGDVAFERISHANMTVWLVDSNVLIGLIALSSSSNALYRECFERIGALGLRLFATERLFDEVHQHFHFANQLIARAGDTSASVLAAASGDAPYFRSNAFLEGFVKWRAAGKPHDWSLYLFEAFGHRSPTAAQIRQQLRNLGVEIIDFCDWPGFQNEDYEERDNLAGAIVKKVTDWAKDRDIDALRDPLKKAQPEAEVLVIIKKEREGSYFILSPGKQGSPSYFISDTSVLNIIVPGEVFTWQPDSFVKFVFSLAPAAGKNGGDRAFDAVLLAVARNGISLVDDDTVSTVFKGIIDQDCLNITEQRQQYDETLGPKYGESVESVIQRLSPRYRSQACIQLAEERVQLETSGRIKAEKETAELRETTKQLQKRLKKLEPIAKKQQARQERAKRKKRKSLSRSGKKKKGKK
jgi:hypothetical protein